jgi:predicted anti-sigma-YlaC factor YlaD
MNCLRPADIYLYLENGLDPAAAREADEHLALCPGCRSAFEERRALMDAVAGIPDFEVPPDLAGRILARIPPDRSSLFGGLVAFIIGLSSFFLGGLAYVILTGQSLTGFLIDANRSAWGFMRDASLAFIKFAKLTALGLDLLIKFIGEMGKGLALFSALIRPEVYAAVFLLFLVLTALLVAGFRKMSLHGEKP